MHEIGGGETVEDVNRTLEQAFGHFWMCRIVFGAQKRPDVKQEANCTIRKVLYCKIKLSLGSQIVCNLRCKFYVRSHIRLDWRRTEEGEVEKHVF